MFHSPNGVLFGVFVPIPVLTWTVNFTAIRTFDNWAAPCVLRQAEPRCVICCLCGDFNNHLKCRTCVSEEFALPVATWSLLLKKYTVNYLPPIEMTISAQINAIFILLLISTTFRIRMWSSFEYMSHRQFAPCLAWLAMHTASEILLREWIERFFNNFARKFQIQTLPTTQRPHFH